MQAKLAERFGATRVKLDQDGYGPQRAAVVVTGARAHRPIVGDEVLTGGFDLVFDGVGSQASVDASLRVVAPRGRLVLLGTAGELEHLDLTLAWARELRIIGSYVYGREASLPGSPHTFDYLLNDPKTLSYRVVTPAGDMVGFAFVMVNDNNAAHLTTIGVAPEHRRRGMARLLLAHVEDALRTREIGTVMLEVRIGNIAAQNLYRDSGYITVQRVLKYYTNGEDCFLMMKGLV